MFRYDQRESQRGRHDQRRNKSSLYILYMAAAVVEPFAPRVKPKRAVVIMTLHGELDDTCRVVYHGKMKAYKVNAVTAGVCNILTDGTANKIVAYFRDRSRSLYGVDIDQAGKYLKKRASEMDPVYTKGRTKSTTVEGFSNITGYFAEDLVEYLNASSKQYQLHSLESYIEKRYILDPDEKKLPRNDKNNSVYLLDDSGRFEDLCEDMDKLRRWRNKREHLLITTSDLLEFVEELGYEELVMLDLSCMVNANNPSPTERENRSFRRGLENERRYGYGTQRPHRKPRRLVGRNRKTRTPVALHGNAGTRRRKKRFGR